MAEEANYPLNQLLFTVQSSKLPFQSAMDIVTTAVVDQAQSVTTLKAMTASSKYNPNDLVGYSDKTWLSQLRTDSPLFQLLSSIFPSQDNSTLVVLNTGTANSDAVNVQYDWQSQAISCLLRHHHNNFHSERARRFQHNILQISGSTLAANLCRYAERNLFVERFGKSMERQKCVAFAVVGQT